MPNELCRRVNMLYSWQNLSRKLLWIKTSIFYIFLRIGLITTKIWCCSHNVSLLNFWILSDFQNFSKTSASLCSLFNWRWMSVILLQFVLIKASSSMTRKKTLATPKRGVNEGSRKSWSRQYIPRYLVVVKDLVISVLFCE